MSNASHRIVSLISSATEIVSALGFQDHLVGRSHECDFPLAVKSLPQCSQPRININATSSEIDRSVKASVADALSIYEVFRNQLEALQPTHILTQTQCDVCAVSVQDVENALCDVIGSRPQIVALSAMDLSGVWEDIQRVANALNDEAAGVELVQKLQSRLRDVRESVEVLVAPTIACIEWLEPLMVAGNWVPELLEIASGRDLFGKPGLHSPYITWENLVRADPDVIALMPCGFDIPRTQAELSLLTDHPAWNQLTAVQTNRVYITDGNQYFNRPGPRLIESAEILSEILHGAESKHHGSGWVLAK